VKDNRPVNLDISTIRLPITAYVSILHRISGVIMVVASFLLLWALDLSLSSAESFASLGDLLSSPLAKFVVWGIVTALIYHSFAGVRHLIMDFGVGETMEGGILGARLVFVLTAVSAVLVGVALW
jgi:succinate dehydrogenase / fumarate reductase cytochrome b subunit